MWLVVVSVESVVMDRSVCELWVRWNSGVGVGL